MLTATVKDFKNGKKYLCKDFYIDCNIYGIYGNKSQWEIRREHDGSFVANGYENTRSSALKLLSHAVKSSQTFSNALSLLF